MDVNVAINQLNMMKAAIERAKTDRAKAEANAENYNKQLAENSEQIMALGFSPETADQDEVELDRKIESYMASAHKLIPSRYLQPSSTGAVQW